jgi:hypothetical protein
MKTAMNYIKLTPTVTDRPIPSRSSRSRRKCKSISWQLISLLFGMAWILPAVLILYLNFTRYIVGPSIGCLKSSCRLNLQASTQIKQAETLGREDRNASGALQIVAKILDGWFCAIAASLVYNILKIMAGRNSSRSLPVGYIHAHTECTEIASLRSLFWDRVNDAHIESKRLRRQHWWTRKRQYFFIAFLAFICILCNLMGPATAILVIPNVQWININQAQSFWFGKLLTDQPPSNGSSALYCSENALMAGAYNCTGSIYAASTDSIVAGAVATDDQINNLNPPQARPNALLLPPIWQHANVSFTVNISDSLVWVPARQILLNLSVDLMDFDATTTTNEIDMLDYPESGLYNRSLEVRLQEHGPVLGQRNGCFMGNTTTDHEIGPDRSVICYDGQNSTKCVPLGKAWTNITQASADFTIQNSTLNATVFVSIYTTSDALEIPKSMRGCLTSKTCPWDWDTVFSDSQALINRTGPQQTFVYKIPSFVNDSTLIWCDSQAVIGFADYVLDPDPLSNLIRLVELNVVGEGVSQAASPPPLFVHPDWTLAAWSVNNNSAVVGTRGAARKLITAMENWISLGSDSRYASDFQLIHRFMALQSLSLIGYTTTTQKPTNTTSNPPLGRKAQAQVWKYDINSRSSVFGVVVVLLGCLCVMARTFFYNSVSKSATEILVTALNQNYKPLLSRDELDVEREEAEFPVLKLDDSMKNISFHG